MYVPLEDIERQAWRESNALALAALQAAEDECSPDDLRLANDALAALRADLADAERRIDDTVEFITSLAGAMNNHTGPFPAARREALVDALLLIKDGTVPARENMRLLLVRSIFGR